MTDDDIPFGYPVRASEDGMAVATARRQVLAFRLRRQHLARRLAATKVADVTATCSVRNSPAGSAQVALLARVNGVSEERVSAALSGRRLVEVQDPRLVPALVRPEDMAVFTVGGIGTDDASLREKFGKNAAKALAAAGIRPIDALSRVVEAAQAELAGGVRGTGELSAAMTARLPEPMSLWCGRCGSRHIHESLTCIGSWLQPGDFGRFDGGVAVLGPPLTLDRCLILRPGGWVKGRVSDRVATP